MTPQPQPPTSAETPSQRGGGASGPHPPGALRVVQPDAPPPRFRARRRELDRLEKVIAKGLPTFADVGAALAKIRAWKLYKERSCDTFEEYCEKQWGFTASRARQLIGSAKVLPGVTLRNEREARAIAPAVKALGAERATEIIDMVRAEKGEDYTAGDIRGAIAESTDEGPATPVKAGMDPSIRDRLVKAAEEGLVWWKCPMCHGKGEVDKAPREGLGRFRKCAHKWHLTGGHRNGVPLEECGLCLGTRVARPAPDDEIHVS